MSPEYTHDCVIDDRSEGKFLKESDEDHRKEKDEHLQRHVFELLSVSDKKVQYTEGSSEYPEAGARLHRETCVVRIHGKGLLSAYEIKKEAHAPAQKEPHDKYLPVAFLRDGLQ